MQRPLPVFSNTLTAIFLLLIFSSCSTQKRISKAAHGFLLDQKELSSAHIGITVYDPGSSRFLYDYQGEKSFIPASNTKLFSLYAGLKYLPDSIVAAKVSMDEGTVTLQATGDPTFLHPDFKYQPLLTFLKQPSVKSVRINTPFASSSFGRGWAWDDYPYDYMAERDPFPIYGNLATIKFEGDSLQTIPPAIKPFVIGTPVKGRAWDITRELGAHFYTIDTTKGTLLKEKTITMAMDRGLFASRYLADTLHKLVTSDHSVPDAGNTFPLYSQPKDSLFKIMMHRSDNFFAEQTLLMAANEFLGEMNDRKMIDTLLKSDLKNLPQPVRWVDGSGLSRYNLFSPKDFVWILQKLETEFGRDRVKTILPGANEGTLEGRYKGYEGRIYAKTGTVSNNLALSGFLLTKRNRQLIFSVMVNNHHANNALVRSGIEHYLTFIIDHY